jgi:hypothetical protein
VGIVLSKYVPVRQSWQQRFVTIRAMPVVCPGRTDFPASTVAAAREWRRRIHTISEPLLTVSLDAFLLLFDQF